MIERLARDGTAHTASVLMAGLSALGSVQITATNHVLDRK